MEHEVISTERKPFYLESNIPVIKRPIRNPLLDHRDFCGDHNPRKQVVSRSDVDSQNLSKLIRRQMRENRKKAAEKMLEENKEAGDRLLNRVIARRISGSSSSLQNDNPNNEGRRSAPNSVRGRVTPDFSRSEDLSAAESSHEDNLPRRSSKFHDIHSEFRQKKEELPHPPTSRWSGERVITSDNDVIDLEYRQHCDFQDMTRVVENEIIAHHVKKLMDVLKSRKKSAEDIVVIESLEKIKSTSVEKLEYQDVESCDLSADSEEEVEQKPETTDEVFQENGLVQGDIDDEISTESCCSLETILSERKRATGIEIVPFYDVIHQKDATCQTPTLPLGDVSGYLEDECRSIVSVASSRSKVKEQSRHGSLASLPKLPPEQPDESPTTSHRLITGKTSNGITISARETTDESKAKGSEIRLCLSKENDAKSASLQNVNVSVHSSEFELTIKISS